MAAIRGVCSRRGWNLWAAHVRTNHVHVVVEAEVRPEKCLNDFKVYASRALNRAGLDGPDRKRWARHGSTRWLGTDSSVQEAIRYVVFEQGEPMAVYQGDLL
ncbi:MAG: transposase [Terriglobales bacterium]